jgi:hypothetical protein
MNKEFIPYEQALALKELGFDEPCIGKWLSNLQSNWKEYTLVLEMGEDNRNAYLLEGACSAPLYQQVFRWFREKYNLISYIHPLALLQDTKKWCYEITNFESSWDEDSDLHSPEEAEQACLIKLIEIVKKK